MSVIVRKVGKSFIIFIFIWFYSVLFSSSNSYCFKYFLKMVLKFPVIFDYVFPSFISQFYSISPFIGNNPHRIFGKQNFFPLPSFPYESTRRKLYYLCLTLFSLKIIDYTIHVYPPLHKLYDKFLCRERINRM